VLPFVRTLGPAKSAASNGANGHAAVVPAVAEARS
jgi:hypothetical protein